MKLTGVTRQIEHVVSKDHPTVRYQGVLRFQAGAVSMILRQPPCASHAEARQWNDDMLKWLAGTQFRVELEQARSLTWGELDVPIIS